MKMPWRDQQRQLAVRARLELGLRAAAPARPPPRRFRPRSARRRSRAPPARGRAPSPTAAAVSRARRIGLLSRRVTPCPRSAGAGGVRLLAAALGQLGRRPSRRSGSAPVWALWTDSPWRRKRAGSFGGGGARRRRR